MWTSSTTTLPALLVFVASLLAITFANNIDGDGGVGSSSAGNDGDSIRIAYCAVQICPKVPWYYPLFAHSFRSAAGHHDVADEGGAEMDFYMLRVVPDDDDDDGTNANGRSLLSYQRETMCDNVGANWMLPDDKKSVKTGDEVNSKRNELRLPSIDDFNEADRMRSPLHRLENRNGTTTTDGNGNAKFRENIFYKEVTDSWFAEKIEERIAGRACQRDEPEGGGDHDDFLSAGRPLRNEAYWVYRLFAPQFFREEWFDLVEEGVDGEAGEGGADSRDDEVLIVENGKGEGGEGEGKKTAVELRARPKYTHWGYLDYDMVFSNEFPDRVYSLYRDSKKVFNGVGPDIMSFPDQQGMQLFLAGQNTVYKMTEERKDGTNGGGGPRRRQYHPFHLSDCSSLFDSDMDDSDSLDEVQASLSAIAGLGDAPRLAFDFGAQREATDVTSDPRFDLRLGLSRDRAFGIAEEEEDRAVVDKYGSRRHGRTGERVEIEFVKTKASGQPLAIPPEDVTFEMLSQMTSKQSHMFMAQGGAKAGENGECSRKEVTLRGKVSNDERVRAELRRLYCHVPLQLDAMTWYGSRYVLGGGPSSRHVMAGLLPPPRRGPDADARGFLLGSDADDELRRTMDRPSFFHWHRNLKGWLPMPYCSPSFEKVVQRQLMYITDEDPTLRRGGRNDAVDLVAGWVFEGHKCPTLHLKEVNKMTGNDEL